MLQHLCRRRGSRRRRRAAQETGTRQLLKAGAAWQGCGRAAPACGKLADGEQAQLQAWTGCQPWPPYTPTPAAKPPAGPHTRAHTQLHTHTHTQTHSQTHNHTHTPPPSPELSTMSVSMTRLASTSFMRCLAAQAGRRAGGRQRAVSWQAGRGRPASQLAVASGHTRSPPTVLRSCSPSSGMLPCRQQCIHPPCAMMRRRSFLNCPGCCASSQYSPNMSYSARRVCGRGGGTCQRYM